MERESPNPNKPQKTPEQIRGEKVLIKFLNNERAKAIEKRIQEHFEMITKNSIEFVDDLLEFKLNNSKSENNQ